jgi:hypothetical protein
MARVALVNSHLLRGNLMKKLVVSCLALIAAFAIGGCADAPKGPAGMGNAGVSGIPTGVAFNMHVAGTDQDWDAIKAAGAVLCRHDLSWNGIEKVKGQYDFSRQDEILKKMDARGIRMLFVMAYDNPLYPKAETTDEGRQAYARWAAAAVAHFKGRGVLWEIWNEPNVGFWKGDAKMNSDQFAAQYVALVKAAVPAMRAADPNCFILGGSVSCLWRDSFMWVDAVLKDGLLDTGINALSVHPYGYEQPELCIDNNQPGTKATESYGLLRQKMAAIGKGEFPVVDTEVGYALSRRRGNVTEDHRAMLFVRTCLVDQMCNLHFTTWYNWDENDAATHRVRNFGGQPLPIYNACKNMSVEMAGYHFVERLKVGTAFDYVLAFENGDKDRKIVAWSIPPERGQSQDKAVAHDLAIPVGSGGAVAVRDLFGKPVVAAVADGAVTVKLSASPQYIAIGGGMAAK